MSSNGSGAMHLICCMLTPELPIKSCWLQLILSVLQARGGEDQCEK